MFSKLSDRDSLGYPNKYRSGIEAGVVFSPLALNPLVIFDGDTLTGNNNDLLALWSDTSGNGLDAAQAIEANRPLLKTGANGINGHNSIFCDGTNDSMPTSIPAMGANREMTWAYVYKSDNVSTPRYPFGVIGGDGNWGAFTHVVSLNGIVLALDNDTNTNIIIADFKENGDYAASQNNVSKGSGAMGALATWNGVSGINIASNRNDSGGFFEGKIAYIALFKRQLNTSEKSNLYSFLSDRYIP